MKQIIKALLTVMGVDCSYSGNLGVFYTDEDKLQEMGMTGYNRGIIPVNAVTFYDLARECGIQSPTAFALSNSTRLVNPSL